MQQGIEDILRGLSYDFFGNGYPKPAGQACRHFGQSLMNLLIDETPRKESGLSGVYYDMATRSYVGTASLSMNLDWCSEFAHGSDVMYPVSILAGKHLNKGEKIEHVTGKFRGKITHDVIISAYDSANEDLQTQEKVAGDGVFHTNHGRKIKYRVVEKTGKPIDKTSKNHPFNIGSTGKMLYSMRNDHFEIEVDELYLKTIFEGMKDDPSFQISSMYEMVTVLGCKVFGEFENSCGIRRDYLVVTEISNLPANVNPMEVRKGDTRAIGKIRKIRKMNGWTYVTIEIGFSFIGGESTKITLAYNHTNS